MTSTAEITPNKDAVAAGQAAEVAIVACPKCGKDVLKSGFFAITVSYQPYRRTAGKLVKRHADHASFNYVECGICRERLDTTVEALAAHDVEPKQGELIGSAGE